LILGSILAFITLAAPDTGPDAELPARYVKLLAPGILLNVAMFGITRVGRIRPQGIVDISLTYLAIYALILGLFRHSAPWTLDAAFRGWSPVAILILLYGVMVPARPSKVLLWSLIAVGMDVFALRMMRGGQAPVRGSEYLLALLTPLGGTLMAFMASRALYGLSEDVRKAREIGSYRLVEQLGAGGMGEVWRAKHLLLARPAAIKLIRPQVLAGHGPEEARRLVQLFEREVQATTALTSPHTIQVFDFGVSRDGTFYYVMELLDGFDFQTLVEVHGPLPAERVVHLLRQATQSLHEAHETKLVHRDLKPANLYTCRYGGEVDFVKVLDFGLVIDRRPTVEELEEKGVTGTPAVMAPEMMRFGAPVDARADIYALGCVGYWLLTGKRVFEAETRNDMLVMHSHQRPTTPSKRAKIDVPPGLEKIIMDCLLKNPNKRPQTMRELEDRLVDLDIEKGWSRERREAWWHTHARPDAEHVPALDDGLDEAAKAYDWGSEESQRSSTQDDSGTERLERDA
jgi:eukaryotic-like serine/threonine-protein kinase